MMKAKEKKVVVVDVIRSKPSRRQGGHVEGEVAKGHHAEIVPGEKIVLYGVNEMTSSEGKWGTPGFKVVKTEVPYRKEFKLGDPAEYGSYNLSYYGPITAITEKTVEISERRQGGGKKHRLDLHTFDWRNHDFNADKAAAKNADTMLYI